MAINTRTTALWVWGVGVLPALAGAAFLGASCGPRPSSHAVELMGEDCASCHMPEFKSALSPVHEGVFPTTCGACHSNDAWHPAINGEHPWFPLRNVHSSVACASCHVGEPPIYAGTPNQCYGCHADDFATAANPSHEGFSTDCASCHTDIGWKPAMFDHQWPLTGQHATATCASCHGAPPTYTGTATECVGCHQDDYNNSPYPGHDAFPTTCNNCHTTNAWTPATGSHPENKFPTSGNHNYTCNQCHNAALGPDGAGNADCVGCHEGEHTRANADRDHREVSGYPTGSAPPNFCLDCHADGRN